MRLRQGLFIIALLLTHCIMGQDIEKNILYLAGVPSMEMLDLSDIEKYYELKSRPVRINFSSREKLLSSGLFSPYQVASVLEYISENGEILSYEELSLIDGFSKDFVSALLPFISLDYKGKPGSLEQKSMNFKGTIISNISTSNKIGYGTKIKSTLGQSLEVGLSARSIDLKVDPIPKQYGGYFVFRNEKIKSKILIGDFNARFGQGLVLWTGFYIKDYHRPLSIIKRAMSVTPSVSFSGGTCRGVAASCEFGNLSLSIFSDFPVLKYDGMSKIKCPVVSSQSVNTSLYFRNCQIGMTGMVESGFNGIYNSRLSIDSRACINGTDIFGEVGYDILNRQVAVIGGIASRLSDNVLCAFSTRYYAPEYGKMSCYKTLTKINDELGAVFACETKYLDFSVDYNSMLTKKLHKLSFFMGKLYSLNKNFRSDLRLVYKSNLLRKENRVDCRGDLIFERGKLLCKVRANLVYTGDYSSLAYVESGYIDSSKALYLRGTVFFADTWKSRLYAYERDAPENFSVPAYYGRGYSLAMYGNIGFKTGKFSSIKLYIKARITAFPWSVNHTYKSLLRFQLIYRW